MMHDKYRIIFGRDQPNHALLMLTFWFNKPRFTINWPQPFLNQEFGIIFNRLLMVSLNWLN